MQIVIEKKIMLPLYLLGVKGYTTNLTAKEYIGGNAKQRKVLRNKGYIQTKGLGALRDSSFVFLCVKIFNRKDF